MRSSQEKSVIASRSRSSSSCFTAIIKSFTGAGNLPSPPPSDHLHHRRILPGFKSNGCIHPKPIEAESLPTSKHSEFLDHNGGSKAGQPGLVARLMGLESMPYSDVSFLRDKNVNLRSKSLNSLHLYIFPDNFLENINPLPPFSDHQRQQPGHRRFQTSSSVLCVESSASRGKLNNPDASSVSKLEKRRNGRLLEQKEPYQQNESNTSKDSVTRRKEIEGSNARTRGKALESKVADLVYIEPENHNTRKCRSQKDYPTKEKSRMRKMNDCKRKEIKCTDSSTRLRKKKGVCRDRSADQFDLNTNDKHKRNRVSDATMSISGPLPTTSKEGSQMIISPSRRRPSRKIKIDQYYNTNQGPCRDNKPEGNATDVQINKLATRPQEDRQDCLERLARICRLTEECVRDNEWINFEEDKKELSMDFAGEMMDILLNQFLDELLV